MTRAITFLALAFAGCSGSRAGAPPTGPPATCSDGVQDRDETDVDCGGSCPPCANGRSCIVDGDCRSQICSAATCAVRASCLDGVKNGGETDADCGGGVCSACGFGKACRVDGDCQSGDCAAHLCTRALAFASTVLYPAGQAPVFVVAADFDGDGKIDAAVADAQGQKVEVLLGAGRGVLGAAASVQAGPQPTALAVADVDGDGAQDLVAANPSPSGGVLAVMRGNGDGTFRAPALYPAGLTLRAVVIADFNVDGRADLAAADAWPYADASANGLALLLGGPMGTFGRPVAVSPSCRQPSALAVGDWNGDGRPDLVLACATGLGLLLGHGDGTFGGSTSYPGPTPVAIAVGDLNRDGRADLVTANASRPDGMSVLLGRGDGTFLAAVAPVTVAGDAVALVDLDGDGRLDAVMASALPQANLQAFLGGGDGTLRLGLTPNVGRFPRSLAIADLDGDGLPDVLVAGDDGLGVVLNRSH